MELLQTRPIAAAPWQAVVANTQPYRDKIEAIARVLEQEPLQDMAPGVLSGLPGTALFFSYFDRLQGTDRHRERIEALVVRSFDLVQARWYPASFCSGLSGLLWAAFHLSGRGAPALEPDWEEVEDFLTGAMKEYAGKNDFDFLHGANGIFYLLLEHHKAVPFGVLEEHIERLHAFALPGREGALAWESVVDIRSPKKVYNLSLSHGMSSTIILLAEFLRQFPGHARATALLEGAVLFLLQSKNGAGQAASLFPNYVSHQPYARQSRLGWCYGDLGIGLALKKAAGALGRQDWDREADSIFLHAARRLDLQEGHVRDASLCHGSAGIAHIFNRMYQETGLAALQSTALYWYEQTLRLASFEDGPAGYKLYKGEGEWKNETNLLEGIAGIGLALMAAIDAQPPSWDRSLLIG